VEGAAYLGYKLVSRTTDQVCACVRGGRGGGAASGSPGQQLVSRLAPLSLLFPALSLQPPFPLQRPPACPPTPPTPGHRGAPRACLDLPGAGRAGVQQRPQAHVPGRPRPRGPRPAVLQGRGQHHVQAPGGRAAAGRHSAGAPGEGGGQLGGSWGRHSAGAPGAGPPQQLPAAGQAPRQLARRGGPVAGATAAAAAAATSCSPGTRDPITFLGAGVGWLQDEMARGGYRTLVIAQRQLSEAAYSSWRAEFDAASVSLVDREQKVGGSCCSRRVWVLSLSEGRGG